MATDLGGLTSPGASGADREMAVIGGGRKGPGANDQVVLLGSCNADLDPEFVRLARFALADVRDFRRVQGVKLVLTVYASGTSEPQRGDLLHAVGQRRQATFRGAHDQPRDRPLALEHPVHAPVLSGVAAPSPLEAADFLLEGLAQFHVRLFGDQPTLLRATSADGCLRVT